MTGMGEADARAREESTGRFGGYLTIKPIGSGGMGTVYEARHTMLGKRVALKAIKESLARDQVSRERFLREARAIALVSHPHVVDVFDVGIEDERAFIVMELLEGETLAAMLARRGKLAVAQAVDLLLPVISAAAAIHDAGLVHRDLKPSNIMLAQRGRFAVEPVVLDFGISRAATSGPGPGPGDDPLTEPHLLVGTLPYLAPEQLRDARAAGPHSDQYALGVMLYECVTGRRPFAGADRYELMHAVMTGQPAPPSTIASGVPRELDDLILRALARRPDARFPSMRALGGVLLSFADRSAWKRWASELAGVDPAADGAPSSETAQDLRWSAADRAGDRPPRRRRWLGATAGALALAAVAVAAGLSMRRPVAAPPAPAPPLAASAATARAAPGTPAAPSWPAPLPSATPDPPLEPEARAMAVIAADAEPAPAQRRARSASPRRPPAVAPVSSAAIPEVAPPDPAVGSPSAGKPAETAQADDVIEPFTSLR